MTEIERLRAENERLRKVLENLALNASSPGPDPAWKLSVVALRATTALAERCAACGGSKRVAVPVRNAPFKMNARVHCEDCVTDCDGVGCCAHKCNDEQPEAPASTNPPQGGHT